ncbi:hypothetical protein ABT160_36590 [Streptomyces sp. NPDC001941]|uniref:hypothetical protein n=1 Tax=Streptomyces sp. NPDC001941 TaxID=3154659 RepID=UPI00331CAB72
MLPERLSGDGGGELVVPMGWFYVQCLADRILRLSGLGTTDPPVFRAGRDVLALTVFFTTATGGGPPDPTPEDLHDWMTLTTHEPQWHGWMRAELEHLVAEDLSGHLEGADLSPVLHAWQWLQETELLPPPAPPSCLPAGVAGSGARGLLEGTGWVPAWRVGLSLGHLALQL